jgi:hypothetical protein
MSRLSAAARCVARELRTCAPIFLLLVFAATLLPAQCPSTNDDPNFIFKRPGPVQKPANEEPLLPEAGYLTNTHYTSQFFGFGFDLPLTAQGHEIMISQHSREGTGRAPALGKTRRHLRRRIRRTKPISRSLIPVALRAFLFVDAPGWAQLCRAVLGRH